MVLLQYISKGLDRISYVATSVVSCLVVGLFLSSYLQASDKVSDYTLGPGDRISIYVFEEDELTLEDVLVGQSGTISFPFIGEILVEKMTPSMLDSYITSRLKGDYLVQPIVTVSISSYRNIYVNGEVEKPGGFPYQPGMTVRMAVSLAGGFSQRANKDAITVVHGESEEKVSLRIRLDDPIKPGDILTIDRSFF